MEGTGHPTRVPKTPAELGVPASMVQDFTLRRALFEGRTSTLQLSEALYVNPSVMNEVVEELRDMRYLEVHGLEGRNYVLGLTNLGREAANERMRLCRYAGSIPVPLNDYRAVIAEQKAAPEVTLALMEAAFSDLVVNTKLLDALGPALIAEGAMFLYGPPGTGKTSIAERLIRIHDDPVYVPRAIEVDSQVITVFDPIVHQPIDPQPIDIDSRWVLCRRPCIIAGGELTASMLDLTHEVTNGIYLAPLQMQANNGIFVIDDFGRQNITPEKLLNRWIVPLDRRVDYLSLSYGVKFQIPFDCKVVFSTNLKPSSLGDEAFFRRIQNKILVPSISDDEFDTVLGRAATRFGVTVEEGAAAYLRAKSRENGDGDLRPYLPIEVCKILRAVCMYRDEALTMNPATIDAVAEVYFTQEKVALGVEADGSPTAPPTSTPTGSAPEAYPPAATIDLDRQPPPKLVEHPPVQPAQPAAPRARPDAPARPRPEVAKPRPAARPEGARPSRPAAAPQAGTPAGPKPKIF